MTDTQLLKRYLKKQKIEEIALDACRSPSFVMKRLKRLREEKEIQVTPRLAAAEERRQSVKELRQAGWTNAEIATELGMSAVNVSKIVAKFFESGELEPRVNRFKHEGGEPTPESAEELAERGSLRKSEEKARQKGQEKLQIDKRKRADKLIQSIIELRDEDMSNAEIAEELGMEYTTLTKKVSKLIQSGVIRARKAK